MLESRVTTICFLSELVLQQEQEEYKREGIQWEHIDYFNNVVICQLIDQQHKGIIALMDEACLQVGKVTDTMLLEAMDGKLKSHNHYSSRRTDPMNKLLSHSEDFLIKHYAGDVVYTVGGFIEKNRDTLFQDFKRLLFNSNNEYLKTMWPEGADHITKTTKRPLTAGTLFKNSMLALMKIIHSKEPHYVRCIKPNDAKSPVLFDKKLVEHQVRRGGGGDSGGGGGGGVRGIIDMKDQDIYHSIISAAGRLPRPPGECEGQESRVRLQAGVLEVSQVNIMTRLGSFII